jgi:hypothetical protein
MSRTTSDAVKKLVEVDATISTDLAPFIETASSLVDDVVATAKKSDGSDYYTAPKLELIERWLAAHFYTIRDNRPASEKAGSVSVNYQYEIGKMLSSSMQGQTALMLDTAGGLASLSKQSEDGKPRKVGAYYLGSSDLHDIDEEVAP